MKNISSPPALCPSCSTPVPPQFSFCPNCGKQLKERQLSTSIFTQTWIYAVSVLLPPIGLWPGIKYFKHRDPKAKQIGTAAIILTVLSTVITLWYTFAFVNSYMNSINQALNGL